MKTYKIMKYSKNVKLNNILVTIQDQLLNICDKYYNSISEIERYMDEFPNEPDYNIAQYGNVLIYNHEIEQLYKDYKSLKNASPNKLWSI